MFPRNALHVCVHVIFHTQLETGGEQHLLFTGQLQCTQNSVGTVQDGYWGDVILVTIHPALLPGDQLHRVIGQRRVLGVGKIPGGIRDSFAVGGASDQHALAGGCRLVMHGQYKVTRQFGI